MRILLVEDDSMIAQAIVGSLKDDGYAVDWVNNGNTAETTLASQSYDIILLDLGLPGKDGIQVLQHARASRNATPILILTARDDITKPPCWARWRRRRLHHQTLYHGRTQSPYPRHFAPPRRASQPAIVQRQHPIKSANLPSHARWAA